MRGAAGAAHGQEQRYRDDQENEIRRPHREERRHDEPVAQLLAADEADVVDRKHCQARADHEPDAAPRVANGERHAEQGEDYAGCRDRQFLLNLDFVDGHTLTRCPKPLAVRRRRLRRLCETRDGPWPPPHPPPWLAGVACAACAARGANSRLIEPRARQYVLSGGAVVSRPGGASAASFAIRRSSLATARTASLRTRRRSWLARATTSCIAQIVISRSPRYSSFLVGSNVLLTPATLIRLTV